MSGESRDRLAGCGVPEPRRVERLSSVGVVVAGKDARAVGREGEGGGTSCKAGEGCDRLPGSGVPEPGPVAGENACAVGREVESRERGCIGGKNCGRRAE